jgi:hypothetical protein
MIQCKCFEVCKWIYYIIFNNHAFFTRNFFNSDLFWLNSHHGHACLVLRACRCAAFLDHNAKKGCEFNEKRCDFKIFLLQIHINKL